MLLVKKEANNDGIYHEIQEQSWQAENWLGDEWLIVPDDLRDKLWGCTGCCDLVIKKGELVDITPKSIPVDPDEVRAQEISALKQELADMDYMTSKYADGEYTVKEWNKISAGRKKLREQIRALEKKSEEQPEQPAESDETNS